MPNKLSHIHSSNSYDTSSKKHQAHQTLQGITCRPNEEHSIRGLAKVFFNDTSNSGFKPKFEKNANSGKNLKAVGHTFNEHNYCEKGLEKTGVLDKNYSYTCNHEIVGMSRASAF